ncbi:hypothetical protein MP228_010585 [Amoeboaphelidium protococcarum]|nr:hypothetical protein MP228_010585 [Amoeboaphelidium protococcarum]
MSRKVHKNRVTADLELQLCQVDDGVNTLNLEKSQVLYLSCDLMEKYGDCQQLVVQYDDIVALDFPINEKPLPLCNLKKQSVEMVFNVIKTDESLSGNSVRIGGGELPSNCNSTTQSDGENQFEMVKKRVKCTVSSLDNGMAENKVLDQQLSEVVVQMLVGELTEQVSEQQIQQILDGRWISQNGVYHYIDEHGEVLAFKTVFTYPYRCGLINFKQSVVEVLQPDSDVNYQLPKHRGKVNKGLAMAYQLSNQQFSEITNNSDVNTVLMSLDMLIKQDILSGSKIIVKYGDRKRVVQVKLIELDGLANQIVVHPYLYAQLKLPRDSVDCVKIEKLFADKDQSNTPSIAQEIKVQMIVTPDDFEFEMGQPLDKQIKIQRFYEVRNMAMKRYFGLSQTAIAPGDLFQVPVDYYTLYDDKDSPVSQGGDRILSLSFIVKSINGAGVDLESTDQYLVDPVNTKVEIDNENGHSLLPLTDSYIPHQLLNYNQLASQQVLRLIKANIQQPCNILIDCEEDIPIEQWVSSVCSLAGYKVLNVSAHELNGFSTADMITYIQQAIMGAGLMAPCVIYLQDINGLSIKPAGLMEEQDSSSLIQREEKMLCKAIMDNINRAHTEAIVMTGLPIVFIASTSSRSNLSENVRRLFQEEVAIKNWDRRNHIFTLEQLFTPFCASDVDFGRAVAELDSLSYRELTDIHDMMLVKYASSSSSSGFSSKLLDHEQFINEMLEYQKLSQLGTKFALSAIPDISFDDVGGLEEAKQEIYDSIILPMRQQQQQQMNISEQSTFSGQGDGSLSSKRQHLQRTGLLFYGSPGSGKSLLAKAIANELRCNFLSVKGPELMNMYVGETEKNVRDLFAKARKGKRTIIFMDELDAMAPRRESEGVMSRVVSQLLAEMDGIQQQQSSSDNGDGAMVFVIGATNRIDLLDPSLLRTGRFDRLIYLETATTRESQLKILQAQTRKLNLDDSVDLQQVCNQIPLSTWTGADFKALCNEAVMRAVSRNIEKLERDMQGYVNFKQQQSAAAPLGLMKGKLSNLMAKRNGAAHHQISPNQFLDMKKQEAEDYTKIVLTMADFIHALGIVNPSVSEKDLARYRASQRSTKAQILQQSEQ